MKIVYVSTRSDTFGGSNIHIRDLAVKIQGAGHEVIVLGGGNGRFASDLRERGIRYEPLQFLGRPIRPLRDLRAVGELRSAVSRLSPDLVSLHTAKAGFVGRLALRDSRVPIVYTAHGWTFTDGMPNFEAGVYASLERLVAHLAVRIVNVCDYERILALKRRVGTPERHVVIHNGMPDVSAEVRANPAADSPRILMVARFELPKDHSTLFNALALCKELSWSLDLVGDGPREAASRAQIEQLGLGERVRFLGHRTDVAELLAGSQLFVLMSRWEGFPRSVLEAMRAGLPVIASAVGGVREAVHDGINGFAVPSGDHRALASRLRELLIDGEERRRLGAAGRRLYEERFTFDVMASKTIDLYQQLLSGILT